MSVLGMVALNPEPWSYWWKYPDRLLYELMEAGCLAFKLQANLPGMSHKDVIGHVVRNRSRWSHNSSLLLHDHKRIDIESTMYDLVAQDIEEIGFDRTTVFIGEDAFPELEHLAAHRSRLLCRMVGVAGFTSQSDATIRKYQNRGRAELLLARIGFCYDLGMREFVCAVSDVEMLRAHFPKIHRFYTPGIRMEGESANDQEVVGTPRDAAQAGAIWIGGRWIANAKKPGEVYTRYVTSSCP